MSCHCLPPDFLLDNENNPVFVLAIVSHVFCYFADNATSNRYILMTSHIYEGMVHCTVSQE